MDFTEEERQAIREKVEKLKESRFKQQMLPAWRPIPSFRVVMSCFIVNAIIFVGLGIMILNMSQNIQEVTVAYNTGASDDPCKTFGKKCNLTFEVTELINSPVYVFYQIEGFY
jgi:hypothetical protein